jgi:hypothetical protein
VKSLAAKYKAAIEGIEYTKEAFDDLNDAIKPDLRESWMSSEKMALELRGEHLKIYDVQIEKGAFEFKYHFTQS